jgi:hypothetical protein
MARIPLLRLLNIILLVGISASFLFAQPSSAKNDEKAEAIIAKAVQNLGGDRYVRATSQYGRGKFSVIKEGAVASFQTFADVIVYPDRERTEFKGGGTKSVQTNVGNGGWLLDGDMDKIRDQTDKQIRNFKNGLRVSLDNLLRGQWRQEATLNYVGKRPASLGKRNDVIRLTFNDDGMSVEFEFSDDGLPAKAIYKRMNADNEDTTEEDRYAQFVDVSGIKAPFIIDRYTNGKQNSRINYESIEFNKSVPDSIFAKPSNLKELKKDLRP